MPTLLLRFAAPLQSWGSCSKFETRTTEKMPTKSGVIGILAAALGFKRDADLSRFSELKFGVRADREGETIIDFHTAKSAKDSYVTYRHYLTDAIFLAGVEGDAPFLAELENALKNPKFPLFLGRRSCPPTLPIIIGIREKDLSDALREEPPLCADHKSKARVRIETDESDAGMFRDQPISFDPRKRIYGYRNVREFFVEFSDEENETKHDAMSELR